MKKPKVSVIIPVYNRKKEIVPCLESVFRQNYENYEVIVVDGNSKDGTLEILQKMGGGHKNLYVLVENERGIGAARNTGERAAKGDIIMMTDSDCIVPADWIGKMVREILKGECAIQGFQYSLNKNTWSRISQRFINYLYTVIWMGSEYIDFVDTKNFAIKKCVLAETGFSGRKIVIGNDFELMIRLKQRGCKVKFSKDIRVGHIHADSLIKVFRKEFGYGFWAAKICAKYEKSLINNPHSHYNDFVLIRSKNLSWIFFDVIKRGLETGEKHSILDGIYNIATCAGWRFGMWAGIRDKRINI